MANSGTENEVINYVLNELQKGSRMFAQVHHHISNSPQPPKKSILEKMMREDLIESLPNGEYRLLKKGQEVLEYGGYEKYQDTEKERRAKLSDKEREQEDRIKKLDEKLDIDIENGRLQGIALRRTNRTFWISFAIVIIGFVLTTLYQRQQIAALQDKARSWQQEKGTNTTTPALSVHQLADSTNAKKP